MNAGLLGVKAQRQEDLMEYVDLAYARQRGALSGLFDSQPQPSYSTALRDNRLL